MPTATGRSTCTTLSGRQIVGIDPLGHRATTTYDAAGNVSTMTDADNREQVFHYDADNRLTAATWLSSTGMTVNLLTYTYDHDSNQLTAADASGTYSNGYDAQDRLTSQTDPLGLTLTYQCRLTLVTFAFRNLKQHGRFLCGTYSRR